MKSTKRSPRMPATVMLDAEIRRNLKRQAAERDLSVSELINRACRLWFDRQFDREDEHPKPAA